MSRPRALALAVAALFGCGEKKPAAPPAELVVYEDLALLRNFIDLPKDTTASRAVERTLGVNGTRAPGPSDHTLYAYVELTEQGWRELSDPPPDLADARPTTFNARYARALLPATLLPKDDGSDAVLVPAVAITDPRVLARARGRDMTRAHRIGNGLYVVLSTR